MKGRPPASVTGSLVIPTDFSVTAPKRKQVAPEWFAVPTHVDVSKAPGFDGTLTLLSRINGWITVTPNGRDRSHRVGRFGPFDRSKRKYDLHNVSDLTPAWMQTQGRKPETDGFRKARGFSSLREV